MSPRARGTIWAAACAAAAAAAVIAWGVNQGATAVGEVVAAGVWLAIPVAVIAWRARGAGLGDRAVASVSGWLYLAAAVAVALAVLQLPPGTSAFAVTARGAAFLVRTTAPAAYLVGLVPVLVAGAPRRGDRAAAKSRRADP